MKLIFYLFLFLTIVQSDSSDQEQYVVAKLPDNVRIDDTGNLVINEASDSSDPEESYVVAKLPKNVQLDDSGNLVIKEEDASARNEEVKEGGVCNLKTNTYICTGNDLYNGTVSSQDDCSNRCYFNWKCKGWTYKLSNKWCNVKSDASCTVRTTSD